jgi:sugar lactone lactonase YvrE
MTMSNNRFAWRLPHEELSGSESDRDCVGLESSMAAPQMVLSGLAFPESPRWHKGRLWLCDWGAQEVIAVELAGDREVMATVPSSPSGIDWLGSGELLLVSGGDGHLLRQEGDGTMSTMADLRSLSAHPWHEIVVDGRGNTYVNGIGFDYPDGEFAPGLIALVTRDGSAQQVATDLAFPNGMIVTPDNETLIVAESYGRRLTAFDIEADGSLSNRRVWAELDGFPDGICLDTEGAIWYADVPNTRCSRVSEGGQVLRTVELDRGGFACALGGPDRRTLFVVANTWGTGDASDQGQVLAFEAPAGRAGWP